MVRAIRAPLLALPKTPDRLSPIGLVSGSRQIAPANFTTAPATIVTVPGTSTVILTAFFLSETIKEDVCGTVVPVTAYPTWLRRTVIDIAAKIMRHAGKIVLKVSASVQEALDFQTLWLRSGSPPKLSLT